jgi:hypothetical protein
MNVSSKLLALQNNQFIENRVYEEDETIANFSEVPKLDNVCIFRFFLVIDLIFWGGFGNAGSLFLFQIFLMFFLGFSQFSFKIDKKAISEHPLITQKNKVKIN